MTDWTMSFMAAIAALNLWLGLKRHIGGADALALGLTLYASLYVVGGGF